MKRVYAPILFEIVDALTPPCYKERLGERLLVPLRLKLGNVPAGASIMSAFLSRERYF